VGLIVIGNLTTAKSENMRVVNHNDKYQLPFQKNRETAFDGYFREYYAPLCFFAFKMLGDQPAAQDIVEDSFVKLWERREIMERLGSIPSYLYTTVKNACIDQLRAQARKRNGIAELGINTPAFEQSVFYKIIEAEVLRQLTTAKANLPPKAKRVVELFYFENKSYSEIAALMGISVNTVKNQKIRALKLLRKQFPYLTALLYLLEEHRG
jgi:RNA polymerase sigma-70 factor (family 1)